MIYGDLTKTMMEHGYLLNKNGNIISGWWFQRFFIFHNIYDVILPIDFHSIIPVCDFIPVDPDFGLGNSRFLDGKNMGDSLDSEDLWFPKQFTNPFFSPITQMRTMVLVYKKCANTPFRPQPSCPGENNKGIREYKSPTPVKLYIHFTFIEDLQ